MKKKILTRISESAKLVMKTFVTVCIALFRQTTTETKKQPLIINYQRDAKSLSTYRQRVHCQLYQRKISKHIKI